LLYTYVYDRQHIYAANKLNYLVALQVTCIFKIEEVIEGTGACTCRAKMKVLKHTSTVLFMYLLIFF